MKTLQWCLGSDENAAGGGRRSDMTCIAVAPVKYTNQEHLKFYRLFNRFVTVAKF